MEPDTHDEIKSPEPVSSTGFQYQLMGDHLVTCRTWRNTLWMWNSWSYANWWKLTPFIHSLFHQMFVEHEFYWRFWTSSKDVSKASDKTLMNSSLWITLCSFFPPQACMPGRLCLGSGPIPDRLGYKSELCAKKQLRTSLTLTGAPG